jgi:hypothetical protein
LRAAFSADFIFVGNTSKNIAQKVRDDPSQKIIGVSASGFCLKERLGNLRNVIDQNSDEMRIAMIAMQDEQFAHQTFMSELCNHKHFFSNQFRPCHRIDFKAPYSTFQCQMTKGLTRSKNDVTQPSRHHAMHRIPMQGILD